MAGEWYYKAMGSEAGPVSPAELKDLAESGFLPSDVLVRQGPDGEWIPAGEVRGLLDGSFEGEAEQPPRGPPADADRKAAAASDRETPSGRPPVAPPPSQPEPAGAEWYCQVMEREIGPLTRSALAELAASGFLAAGALVRQGADGDWIPSNEVKGLLDQQPPPESAEESDLAGAEPVSAESPATVGDRSGSPGRAREQPSSKPAAAQDGWYCDVMGAQTGPLSSAQLKELAASGFLTPDVPVRNGVGGDWGPASRVKGLFPEASTAGEEKGASPPTRRPSKAFPKSDRRARRQKSSAKPAPAREVIWYYRPMEEDIGPLSSAELQELANLGLLTPDVPVRLGTEGKWIPARQVLGLFDETIAPAASKQSRPKGGSSGAARRPGAQAPAKPTRKAAAQPAPEAPLEPLVEAAPKPPVPPSPTPVVQPAPPLTPQPAPARGMADLLDEALAEPTPSGAKPGVVDDTPAADPPPQSPMLSATPDPAAFESRHRGYNPLEKPKTLGEKVTEGVVWAIIDAILSNI